MLISPLLIWLMVMQLSCQNSAVDDYVMAFALTISYFFGCAISIIDVSEMVSGPVFRMWLVTVLLVWIPLWCRVYACLQ